MLFPCIYFFKILPTEQSRLFYMVGISYVPYKLFLKQYLIVFLGFFFYFFHIIAFIDNILIFNSYFFYSAKNSA